MIEPRDFAREPSRSRRTPSGVAFFAVLVGGLAVYACTPNTPPGDHTVLFCEAGSNPPEDASPESGPTCAEYASSQGWVSHVCDDSDAGVDYGICAVDPFAQATSDCPSGCCGPPIDASVASTFDAFVDLDGAVGIDAPRPADASPDDGGFPDANPFPDAHFTIDASDSSVCSPPGGRRCNYGVVGWYQGWCSSLCSYASACLCVNPDPWDPNNCLGWSDEWSRTGCPGANPCLCF